MVAVFIAGFWPVFEKLVIRWSSGDNDYGFLIIPLFLYLCWEKRETFRFAEFSWWPGAMIPAVFSLSLMLFGEAGSVESLLFLGIWGCIASGMAFLYGRRVRLLAFPLLILLFMIPLPPFINRLLTFKLKMLASSLSVALMRLVGISVLQAGNIIDLGVDRLQVVDACSGLRYIMPMFLTALMIGHFFARKIWQQAVLLVAVIPLAIVINGLRIFITGVLTVSGHQELAQNFFHGLAGLVIFLAGGGALLGVALLLRKIGPQHFVVRRPDPGGRPVSRTFAIAATVVFCATLLAGGWFVQKKAGVGNAPARASFDSFPMEIAGWQGKRSYLSREIMEQLWADDYVNAVYAKEGEPNRIFVLIPYYEYQGTRHTVHAPQSCLLGGGWAMLQSRERTITTSAGRQVPLQTMVLQQGDNRMLGSYFFLQRGRVVTDPWLNKFYLMWDSITKGRTDGALVRVEMTLPPGQSPDDAYQRLEKFIVALWALLPRYVPG